MPASSTPTGPALDKLLREGWGLVDLASSWLRPAVNGVDENDLWLNAVPYHHIGGSCAIATEV